MNNAQRFKEAAKPIFGTVSGTEAELRIAVRNVTTFRRVAAMAEVYGGTVAPDTKTYPQLMKIAFAQ